MDSKACVTWNTGKSIDNFNHKFSESRQCKIKKSLKRYYENKDKLSNQQKHIMKKLRQITTETN